MEIIRGKIKKPIKTLIYGPEGIGKSTLASRFPDPLFIDTEGSTSHMDVARLPAPSSWTMLKEEVEYVRDHPDVCRTLVIDTADWAEKMCIEHVCSTRKVDGIESIGYGKGYVYVKEEFGKLLNLLNDVLDKGVNVVVTAHAQMRKFEQPDELGAYDRWELKMEKKTAPMVKEWADMLLFCNYKTMVINVDNQGAQKGKNKVQGGKRVIYATHHACWDAKNRFGLPDEMDMDYESIRDVIESSGSAPAPKPQTKPSRETKPQREEPPAPVILNEEEQIDLNAMMAMKEGAAVSTPIPAPAIRDKPAEKQKIVSPYFSDPDRLPKELKDLMTKDDICEWDIQHAVYAKGYYPEDTLIQNMDPEFIKGWIIAFWPKVKELIAEIKEKQEVPFN